MMVEEQIRSQTPAAILLRNISMLSGETTVLGDICLDIAEGAPTVLLGPNGSGKTTLLRLMMGLASPTTGEVEVAARAEGCQPVRAFVFQAPVMLRRSAAGNVAFALAATGHAYDAARVAGLLARVGLEALADRPARKLSGGERQRLALARALARDPDILFLDEPTASLDPAQTKAVEDIILGVASVGVKIVMATHDLGQARRLAGDIVLLVRGRVAETGPAPRFFQQPATTEGRRFIAGELII